MKKMKILWSVLLLFFFLDGCANKTYSKEERIFLLFKTKTIKYADLAFMYEGKEHIKIEMYSNGQALKALEIDEKRVCLSFFECLDKEAFNAQVLSPYYPKDILSHILQGKAIFASENYKKVSHGFRQELSMAGKYTILYTVFNNEIVFVDSLNKIKIKVRSLD